VSVDARLNKLMPALTAKERAILILRALKDRTAENPLWRSTMPAHQVDEFNRLIVLMNACNLYLPMYITMVEQHTEQLYVRFLWLQSLVALGVQFSHLAGLIPASKRAEASACVDRWPLAVLPWDTGDDEGSWLNLAERMEEGIRLWLVSLWEELRSIDIVVDEVAKEFDGEDPLRPVMRGIMEKTRSKLVHLHATLAVIEPLELREPDDETLDLARTYFENGRRLMNRA
jgi:hypothetical protein